MRNLLASKSGRLTTFFLLYVTEGIPLGFTAVALAAQMRRRGMGTAAIGAFVASLYLPWAWKWVAGPFVDLFYSDRLGRRRAWIVACQVAMAATLLAAMGVDFVTHIGTLTWIVLVHNVFGATQDVAIDALAVTTLRPEERGLANGMMFAGANVGNAIGGAGVLALSGWLGSFNGTFFFAAGAILCVTVFVSLRIRERPTPPLARATAQPHGRGVLGQALAGVGSYVATAARSIVGTRPALAGLVFALLPAGSYSLGLALGSAIAVDLGLSDQRIALLSGCSTAVAALGCVAGGYLSDRFGRRRMIAVYIVLTVIPAIAFAAVMQRAGWGWPRSTQFYVPPAVPAGLVTAFWVASLTFSLANGLMYGARTALFMDLCNPAVAATQFTAYMSLLNLVLSYSAWWQGAAAERIGYPKTILLDVGAGLLSLCMLPLMKPWKGTPEPDEGRGFEPILAGSSEVT